MNKQEYIEAIVRLLEKTSKMQLIDYIYRLLEKRA